MRVEIYRTCPYCRTHRAKMFDYEQYKAWSSGMLAQYAFPDSHPDEREFLISGVCDECWQNNVTDI